MTTYGQITDYEKSHFASKLAQYWTLDAQGTEWAALVDVLDSVKNRIEFRNSFGYARMLSMLRTMCEAASLTHEDRGAPPHIVEGYYGLVRKA